MLNTDLVLCRYICFALCPAHTEIKTVVWHMQLPLLNSFNETKAAFFQKYDHAYYGVTLLSDKLM